MAATVLSMSSSWPGAARYASTEPYAAGSRYVWTEMWSITSQARSRTVSSHVPNVGIAGPELPQATSSIVGSARRIAAPVSKARRP